MSPMKWQETAKDNAFTLVNPFCQYPADLSSYQFSPSQMALKPASVNCLFCWLLALHGEGGQTLEQVPIEAVGYQSTEIFKT